MTRRPSYNSVYDQAIRSGGYSKRLTIKYEANRRGPTFEEILEQLDALKVVSEAKTRELTAAIKTQAATGDLDRPNETVRQLAKEQRKLQADFLRLIRKLERAIGVSEAEVRAIERAKEAEALPSGHEFAGLH